MKVKAEMHRPEPILLLNDYKELGILLIHGFTGTTLELKGLAQHLYEFGYSVHAPLLKGHGTSPEEMKGTTWVDWFASAKTGYERLKREGIKEIMVIGLSMGGSLALKMAQHFPVAGIVTLCAPLKVRDKRIGLVRYLKLLKPYKKRTRSKAEHIERELFHYDKTPLSCIVSLDKLIRNVRQVLPRITQPILIVQAEKDETVDPCSGQLIFELIGSMKKELRTFKESSHIITLDREREELFETITHFIKNVESIKNQSISSSNGR